MTTRSDSKYAEYAAIIMIIVLGLLGVINFGGIATLTIGAVIGAILATYGIYTLAYIAARQSSLEKGARKYFLVWGYIPAAIGISLVLSSIVNILLALSISLIGLAIVALLILRL